MSALVIVAVALGGVVGAPARYVVDTLVGVRLRSELPWGTFVVNATGSLVLGVIVGLAEHHLVDGTVVALVGTGFCGSFTTFSTYMFESLLLAEDRRTVSVVLNVAGSVLVGFAAAALGVALGAI